MKKCVTVVLTLILWSCGQQVKPTDLAKVNGYWEIEKVTLPDGTEKEYTISEIIDRFELKNSKGFRQKVRPQFDGTYISAGGPEKIESAFENRHAFLKYTTDYASWKEEVVEISPEKLVLKNEQDVEYHYKKFIPIDVK